MMSQKVSLLVVDDHDAWRRGIRSLLGEFFEITEACDPREARNILCKRRFDCALLDVRMGEQNVSGFDLAKTCGEVNPFMAVIVMSAVITGHSKYDHGSVSGIIEKNVDPDALREIIQDAVWRKRMNFKVRTRRLEVFGDLLGLSAGCADY